MEERETSERKCESLNRKLRELFGQLGVTLGTNYEEPTTIAFDRIMTRVRTYLLLFLFFFC